MKKTCLIVADQALARLFLVVPGEGPGSIKPVDVLTNEEARERGGSAAGSVGSERNTNRQAGPVHPVGAQRERHRLEHERRFGARIVEKAIALTKEWSEGVIVLIAEPRLLGLMRERLREAVNTRIRVDELAKDYTGLSTAEIQRMVVERKLIC